MERYVYLGGRFLESAFQTDTLNSLLKPERRDQKSGSKNGFIITLLLISLPLFLSCLMVFISLFFCIRNHDFVQSICLKQTLQAQIQIKKALQKLLHLNPLADQLRHTQKYWEQLYREALKSGELTTIAILRAKIEAIKRKRKFLDKKQKNILKSTTYHIESAMTVFKEKTRRFHSSYIRKNHHRPLPLAVIGRPLGDIAPSYYPVSYFSRHQTFSISWKMPLYHFLPKWLERAFFRPGLSLYSCSATIKKRGLKWKATLASLFIPIGAHFSGTVKLKAALMTFHPPSSPTFKSEIFKHDSYKQAVAKGGLLFKQAQKVFRDGYRKDTSANIFLFKPA
ncbi:MAG: hypothetical protein OXM55_00170 [Bdellovibrionales bacterium]|nr:hypothetical protein [Bdellovibrionales bacterium]